MLNASNHCLERYCERILGMSDKNEIKHYIVNNRERLVDEVNKMFEHTEFIYKGQLYDNTTKNYWYRGDYIMVTDTGNTTLVTLYKIDFGFPSATNRRVSMDLMDEVQRLTKKLEEEEFGLEEFIENKESQSKLLEEQIKSLEEQVKLLKEQKVFINEEVKNARRTSSATSQELKRNVLLLCNSLEYRKEIGA
jgi:hypothetical protein